MILKNVIGMNVIIVILSNCLVCLKYFWKWFMTFYNVHIFVEEEGEGGGITPKRANKVNMSKILN